MKKQIMAAVLAGCMLLGGTACGGTAGKTTRTRAENTRTASSAAVTVAESTSAAPEATENTEDETAKFQAAFDAITVDSKYASCKRYVMVNDYDGDGRKEAFGFFGTPEGSGAWAVWSPLHIYYLSADGGVTLVYNGDDEFDPDDALEGKPKSVTDTTTPDFSGSYLTMGGKTFAVFDVCYAYGGDFFSMALTVVDGSPMVSYTSTDLRVAADGYFAADGYDNVEIYSVRNGSIELVGSAADADLAANNGSFNEKTTPEKSWEKYKGGILKALAEYYGYDTQGAQEYIIVDDYDGDGRQEAYAVLAQADTEFGFSEWAAVYYITPDGFIFCVRNRLDDGTEMCGFLRDTDNYAQAPQSVLLSAGKQKFLLWEVSAGGSGSTTELFGVRDGVPYQPEISGQYGSFRQDGGKYYGSTSDFSKGYHDYIDHEFTFDAASGEFRSK